MDKFDDTKMALTFAALSASATRNQLCAQKAEKQGDLQWAKLLEAIAQSESIKTRRALVYLRGRITDVETYMQELLFHKKQMFSEEYPATAAAYTDKGKRHEAETFARYAAVAKNHYLLLNEIEEGNITEGTQYCVCNVCGYIAQNAVPEKCPVCNAVPDKFKVLHA
jgi:rubrerythrin